MTLSKHTMLKLDRKVRVYERLVLRAMCWPRGIIPLSKAYGEYQFALKVQALARKELP